MYILWHEVNQIFALVDYVGLRMMTGKKNVRMVNMDCVGKLGLLCLL